MESLLLALFGAGAILSITAAVWLPLRAQDTVMRRRLDGFVDVKKAASAGPLALELGGSRLRRRALVSPTDGPAGVLIRFFERRIAKAQIALTAREVLIGIGVAGGTALVLGNVFMGPVAGIAGAAAMPLLALAILGQRASKIQKKFVEQLADTVALLGNAVRAGQSVQQALEQVSRDAAEPTRSAFALTVREIGLGASLEDALLRLLERYPSEDLELVTTAINVHSTIGGSLVKILETTATTIRDRARMIAEVKALTAQQTYSAYVLSLLPVIAFVGLRFLSPDYANELLREGAMRFALIGATSLVVVGFLVMRGMSSVDG